MTDLVHHLDLSQGGKAIIDAADLPLAEPFRWWLVCRGHYAATRINGVFTYLHDFLMRPPCGGLVDHRNGDGLDCRRINMRIADKSLNGFNRGRPVNNTSGVKGVVWCACTGRWRAQAMFKKRMVHIGRFDSLEVAASARRNWESRHGLRPENLF